MHGIYPPCIYTALAKVGFRIKATLRLRVTAGSGMGCGVGVTVGCEIAMAIYRVSHRVVVYRGYGHAIGLACPPDPRGMGRVRDGVTVCLSGMNTSTGMGQGLGQFRERG